MFENIILLIIAYMTAGILTEFFFDLFKKIDRLKEAHRDNRKLAERIKYIKNENKNRTLFAIKIAIAESYRRHNNAAIGNKLLKELANTEFLLNKKIGMIDEWNNFREEGSLCK